MYPIYELADNAVPFTRFLVLYSILGLRAQLDCVMETSQDCQLFDQLYAEAFEAIVASLVLVFR